MSLRIACVFVYLIPALSAATVSGPVLGYTVIGDRVHIVPGIPGAAYIGPAIGLRAGSVLAIAPERGYVVASSGDGGIRIAALSDGYELGQWHCSEGTVQSVLLSPLGNAAAVVCSNAVTHVLTGLPAQTAVRSAFRLTAGMIPAAVSDAGNLAAVVMSDGSLSLFEDGNMTTVVKSGRLSDARFLGKSHDLLYTDSGWAQVGLISNGSVSILATASDGLSHPVAAAYTGAETRRVLVIATADKQLAVRSRLSSQIIELPCLPAGLERLNESALRLVCQDDSRFYLIDASPKGIRLLAVPEGGE